MVTRIDVDRLLQLMDAGAVLVDALPESIYRQEHLPGAVSIPLERFCADDLAELDRDAPLITYCFDQHCDLSSRAANRFEHEGFREVYDLVGGRATWTALGLPTEGTVADRRRISHYVEQANTVDANGVIGDVTDWSRNPVAVVNNDGVLLGALDVVARGSASNTAVADVMTPAPGTIRPELRVEEVVERLRADSLEHVFVSAVNGVLLGIVTRDRIHV